MYVDVLERFNVARCHDVGGAPAEVTAAAVASTDPNCVAHGVDHSDGFAASLDGLTTEFVCQSACAAGFYDPKDVKTDDASLYVVTFSHDGEKIGRDHALVLCAFLLRDAEDRQNFRSSVVSLAAGVHSESLKRLNNYEEKEAYAMRTETARATRAAAVVVCLNALRACHDPVAEVCLMLEERVRAGDVTSSPRPFHAADLSGDAALRDDAALAWLRKFIADLPLRTAKKTLSYLNDGVAARLAAADYVGGKDVFAPFDGPPDKEGLENALLRYGVKRELAERIAAQTCEAVLRKPPPRQVTIQSAFKSASAAHPKQAASSDRATHSSPPSQDESLPVDSNIIVVGLPNSRYNGSRGVVVETPSDLAERGRVCVRVGGDTLTLKRANVVLARPPQPPRSSRQPKKKKKKKKAKPLTASEAADFFSGKVRDAK